MRKLSWLVASGLMLGAVSAAADDTAAEAKDRIHESESNAKVKLRQAKPGGESMKDHARDAADKSEAVTARTTRKLRRAGRSTKHGVHGAADKVSDKTN
jgi:hypothetical protein